MVNMVLIKSVILSLSKAIVMLISRFRSLPIEFLLRILPIDVDLESFQETIKFVEEFITLSERLYIVMKRALDMLFKHNQE